MANKLFTIGYANKSPQVFADLCRKYGIDSIVDVRSSPYSGHFFEYNEDALHVFLKKEGIAYLSFKEEFGARRSEEEAYSSVVMDDGEQIEVVDFEKVYKLPAFLAGVERIENGLKKGRSIAFLCSEKDAVDCHRAIMVATFFARRGLEIEHIIDEKSGSYDQEELLKKLRDNFDQSSARFKRNMNIGSLEYNQGSLFGENSYSEPEFVRWWKEFYRNYTDEKGWRLRNYQIGYKKGNEDNG